MAFTSSDAGPGAAGQGWSVPPSQGAGAGAGSGDLNAGDSSDGAMNTPVGAGSGVLESALDGASTEPLDTATLIEQLQADRLWLLRQIDGGAYPDLRLDLAALERELGQLLDQAGEAISEG